MNQCFSSSKPDRSVFRSMNGIIFDWTETEFHCLRHTRILSDDGVVLMVFGILSKSDTETRRMSYSVHKTFILAHRRSSYLILKQEAWI